MMLSLTPDDLRPIVVAVLDEWQARVDRERSVLPDDRLAIEEGEASRLLGIPRHVLRDCRLRKEIVGSRVGKKIVYQRRELLRFLKDREER
jgi:hypothetical protein